MPDSARCTQSVGVPATLQIPLSRRLTARIGWSSVSELLAPERSRSGATTVTSCPARAQGIGQMADAGRVHAIVVADQYAHRYTAER